MDPQRLRRIHEAVRVLIEQSGPFRESVEETIARSRQVIEESKALRSRTRALTSEIRSEIAESRYPARGVARNLGNDENHPPSSPRTG
jgi:hypothetical protein